MNTDRPFLELKGVSKTYGTTVVLSEVDLAVRDGEFITILGPSGSGKTTILRMIGGFTNPSSGTILFEGVDITPVPINKRPINTVFQDYALFPHMTVEQNVGYGLKVRGWSRHDIEENVRQTLELVQLQDLAKRYPAQLSGGQQQRVALARAIICRPRLILLDEPLAALDVELRRQMQSFLKDIQREIKTTFLFVTHDQEEAIAMADRICVMNEGRIQQLGTAHEIYYRPQREFVARFIGDNNILSGRLLRVEGERRQIETPIGKLWCSIDGQPELARLAEGEMALAVFRPEAISLASSGSDGENSAIGRVASINFAGAHTIADVIVDCTSGTDAPIKLRLRFPSRVDGAVIELGAKAKLHWRAEESRLVAS